MENKEEMLTCSFAAKTLKHKNNLASYAGSEIFSLQDLFFFFSTHMPVKDFYFRVKSRELFF